MITKRLTAIIRPSGPGVSSKGRPTINVSGSEISVETYFRILDLASEGTGPDKIVADIIGSMDPDDRDSRANYNAIIDLILLNYQLAHGTNTAPSTTAMRHSIVGRPRTAQLSTVLSPRSVTTHFSHSDPGLKSPVSPEKEEEKLVTDPLKLAAERDAINDSMLDGMAKQRATAAIDLQLRSCLRRHQTVDDHAQIISNIHIEPITIMATIPPPNAATAFQIKDSNEIVSIKQIRWLRRQALKGCTSKCLGCHFSEMYLRDLSPADIQTILDDDEGDLVPTELPSHGEQIVQSDLRYGIIRRISVPDGIYHAAVSMVQGSRKVSRSRTAFFLSERWAIVLKEADVDGIINHWLDHLPRDEHGREIIPAEPEPAPHPGNRMHQLPTVPTTPRNNGHLRTSFSRPPPTYSPRPHWNGVELRHAREVVPQNGHLGPFYPADQVPDPPAYPTDPESSPPGYSSPLAGPAQSAGVFSLGMMQPRRNAISESPLMSPLTLGGDGQNSAQPSIEEGNASRHLIDDLEDYVDEQIAASDPAGTNLRNDSVAPSSPTPSSATMGTFAAAAAAAQHEPSYVSSLDADSGAEALTEREESWRTNGSNFQNLVKSDEAVSWDVRYPDTIITVSHEGNLLTYRARGGIARAIINQYPWRYRALTSAEADQVDDEITQVKMNLADPQVAVDLPPTPEAVLTLAGTDSGPFSCQDGSRDQHACLVTHLSYPMENLPVQDFSLSERFFVYTAYKLMLAKDDISRNFLHRIQQGTQYDIDGMRRAFHDIYFHEYAHAIDRHLENSAMAVRQDMAGQMNVGVEYVLVPYDFDGHLQHGSFQPEVFNVKVKHLDNFLLSLPAELNIFTEDERRWMAPRADAQVDDQLTRRTHPTLWDCTTAVRREILYTLCQNIVAEIFRPATAVNRDTFIEMLRLRHGSDAVLSIDGLRDFMVDLESRRSREEGSTAPLYFDSATFGAPESSDSMDGSAIRVFADRMGSSSPSSAVELSEPTSAQVDLPRPTPLEVLPVPDARDTLLSLRLTYGPFYHSVMSHFPPSTVWTSVLLDSLPNLIRNPASHCISQIHTVIKHLRSADLRLLIESTQRDDLRNSVLNSETLGMVERAERTRKFTRVVINQLLWGLAEVERMSQRRSARRADGDSEDDASRMITLDDIKGLQGMLDGAIMWLSDLGIGVGSACSGDESRVRLGAARPDPLKVLKVIFKGVSHLHWHGRGWRPTWNYFLWTAMNQSQYRYRLAIWDTASVSSAESYDPDFVHYHYDSEDDDSEVNNSEGGNWEDGNWEGGNWEGGNRQDDDSGDDDYDDEASSPSGEPRPAREIDVDLVLSAQSHDWVIPDDDHLP